MTRSYLFLLLASTTAGLGQTTCPAINFAGPQTIDLHPSSGSHLDLIRQADGSWTAFAINDTDPSFVVETTAHFENQIGHCLPIGARGSGSGQSSAPRPLSGAYAPAPAPIAPGKIFVVNGTPTGSSIAYSILDSQHAVISSGVLDVPNAQGNFVGVAEVTGDGKLDAIVISWTGSGLGEPPTLSIFPGNGDGTFGNGIHETLPGTAYVTSLTVADVNGDAMPDVMYEDLEGNQLVVALDPAGNLFKAQTFPLPPAGYIMDLNGDNHPDLISFGSDSSGRSVLTAMLGDGKGGFGTPVTSGPFGEVGQFSSAFGLAAGDLNGDGNADIATGGGLVLLGDGKGGFTRYDQYAVTGASAVFIADINNDGINDVIFGAGTADFIPGSRNAPSAVTVLFGLGSGKFFGGPASDIGLSGGPNSSGFMRMTAGDFDADGRSEVAVFNVVFAASTEVDLTIMKAATDGALSVVSQLRSPHADGFYPTTALSGDFNHDGRQDLLLLLLGNPSGGEIQFYRGRGDDSFDAPVTTTLAESADSMIAADLNGDGVPDIAGTAGNLVWVRPGNGDGTFGSITFSSTGADIAFGDFTSDGKQDLAIASSDGNLTVLPGKGDGTFAAPITTAITGGFPALSENGLATVDTNGDGFLDVILRSEIPESGQPGGTGVVNVMPGNGDGTFRGYRTAASGVPAFLTSLAFADFNRDGVPDLIALPGPIVSHPPTPPPVPPLTVLAGNGDGSFGPMIDGPLSSGSFVIADLNGDGLPDLVDSYSDYLIAAHLNISVAPAALTVVSGATFTPGPLAPGSFASAFGVGLVSPTSTTATLGVQDAAGVLRAATVTFASPEQINFIVPRETAPGPATVILTNAHAGADPPSAPVTVDAIAPALFTVPGFYSTTSYSPLSVAAAYAIRVDPAGNQSFLSFFDSSGHLVPIDVTQPGAVYIALFGTGFDTATATTTTASIEGVPARVTYAGPAPQLPGVDQVNLLVPPSVAGKGVVFVSLAVGGAGANSVALPIQ